MPYPGIQPPERGGGSAIIFVIKAIIIISLIVTIFGAATYFLNDIFLKPRRLAEAEKLLPPPTPPPDPSGPLLARALALDKQGRAEDAREALAQFIDAYPSANGSDEARIALGKLNLTAFLSPTPGPDKELYVVQRGDAIAKIERKFKTSAELIMRINKISDPAKLSIGQSLLIVKPTFTLIIDRQAKRLELLNRGKFFKIYLPRTWNPPATKLPPNSKSQISDKLAWKNGTRIAFGNKEYEDSVHWLQCSISGWTIYGEPDASEPATARSNKPPTGISLTNEEARELSTLLSRGSPVVIE